MEFFLAFVQAIPVSFAALLPVVNPIGTAIILLGMTDGADQKTRKALALAVARNTVFLLFGVLLGGSYLLEFFGITVPIVQTAGGAVLASMGWNLLNQKDSPATAKAASSGPVDPDTYFQRTFYPFTFPISVGPGSVAVALTLSAHTSHATVIDTALGKAGALVAILGVAVLVYLCVAYSTRLVARLGANGTSVLMRLIAFIVVCIGAQISWTGLHALLLSLR